MKKSLLIVLSVAVLGVLGLYINKDKDASAVNNSGSSAAVESTNPSRQTSDNNPVATPPAATASNYKDGTFSGSATDTLYGNVQIAAVISGGKIIDIQFLQMPNDQGNSREITSQAEPLLKQTTLAHQNANIDFVSGATSTSEGFEQSLQSALDKAAA